MSAPAAPEPRRRPRLSHSTLLVGLTPFVPLPVLDGVIKRHLLRRSWRELALLHGVSVEEATLVALTRDKRSFLLGCLGAVLWWPLKKIFKSVFFVLQLKECVDEASEASVRSLLVRTALQRGHLPAQAEAVREAMDAAWERRGGSPVTGWLRKRPAVSAELLGVEVTSMVVELMRHAAVADVVGDFIERLEALPQPSGAPVAVVEPAP
jgi:hypothetical protein